MKFANRKILVWSVLSVILVSVAVIFFMATESNSGVVEEEAKYKLTVSDWVKEGLETSDSSFNQKYVGQIVEISGKVASVKALEAQNSTNVKLESGQEEVIVGALFNKTSKEIQELAPGQDVTVVCECNGVSKPEEDDLISEVLFTLKPCQLKK
jgi:preprotein translocase subunit SecF